MNAVTEASQFNITDINLFGDADSFSADVRINGEFSIHLGTDGVWDFAPEANHSSIEFCAPFLNEGMTTTYAATQVALKIGAWEAVEDAMEIPENWS